MHDLHRAACVAWAMAVVGLLLGCREEAMIPAERSPGTLSAPELRQPENGAKTGSARVPESAPVVGHPLRPRYVWSPVEGATEYRLQVDDDCDVASYRSCAFPSPELDVRVGGEAASVGDALVHTSEAALPVSSVAPLGARFYWRLSACASDGCGPWSEVRYFDAGRLDDDYDGDGYADVVIGAPMHDLDGRPNAGQVFLYYGSPTGVPARCGDDGARCARIDNPDRQAHGRFGASVASAGDLDGDGYADLLIGAPGQDGLGEGDRATAQEGNVFVYYGGPEGIDVACQPGSGGRCARLDNPDDQTDGAFGHSVAGAGDVNADGYDDAIAGAPFQYGGRGEDVAYDSGAAFVYYGGREGLATECVDARRCARLEHPEAEAGAELGAAVAGGGDLDADGHADVVVGSVSGLVLVFYGAPRGVDPSCQPGAGPTCARLESPRRRSRVSVAIVGDIDADGYADLVIGAPPGGRPPAVFGGNVYVHRGAATGVSTDCDPDVGGAGAACARLDHPDGPFVRSPSARAPTPGYAFFGTSVARAGDVNGDGHDDVLVGVYSRGYGMGSFATRAFLLFGSPSGPSGEACSTRDCPLVRFEGSERVTIHSGSVTSGDVDADGYPDVVVGSPLGLGPAQAEVHPFNQGEAFIHYGGAERPAGDCASREDAGDGAMVPSGEGRAACGRLPNPSPQEGGFFGAASG